MQALLLHKEGIFMKYNTMNEEEEPCAAPTI